MRIFITVTFLSVSIFCVSQQKYANPNIILLMADDLGWGDVGYNGNSEIITPNLDKMASESLQFNRFYAAAPVCSPTRGSCLTGRHPERYGIPGANKGHIKKEEETLAESLKEQGYTTGHFGKWHLGTLTKDIIDGRRGGTDQGLKHYSPPWENGYDVCFATEQAVPTWDPMKNQKILTKYWIGKDKYATDNLEGDDSRVIMDRVIPFIEKTNKNKKPFLTVVWFHTPHSPVVAGKKYMDMYPGMDDNHKHYYGCITAMDEQIGRLRNKLRELNIEDNTIVFFTSDNGPAGKGGGTKQIPGARQQGSPGPFRGRKGSLYEGGVRVPGLMVWPSVIKNHSETDIPFVTSDYFPTIMDILGLYPDRQPLDGISIVPLLTGDMTKRNIPICFYAKKKRAICNDTFKLISNDNGESYELYNMVEDKSETVDISEGNQEIVSDMKAELEKWIQSCRNSNAGIDYVSDKLINNTP